jgi:hypothetical protein
LAGVTPPMLLDWFTHLDGTILYGGVVTDRYLAWLQAPEFSPSAGERRCWPAAGGGR